MDNLQSAWYLADMRISVIVLTHNRAHLLRQCVERVLEDAPRVSVTMKLDVRPGTTDALHDKVRAVEDHLA